MQWTTPLRAQQLGISLPLEKKIIFSSSLLIAQCIVTIYRSCKNHFKAKLDKLLALKELQKNVLKEDALTPTFWPPGRDTKEWQHDKGCCCFDQLYAEEEE